MEYAPEAIMVVKSTIPVGYTLTKWKSEGYTPDCIILEWTNTVVLALKIHEIFPDTKLIASEHDVTFVGYERKANYYISLCKSL